MSHTPRRQFLSSATSLAGLALLPAAPLALAAAARPLYKDPAAPLAQRVDDLLVADDRN